MSLREKLLIIQTELKAPKGQTNNYGGYKYRSCEDILEAVKPLLKEQGLILRISDEVVLIGERYYVKANAFIQDAKTEEAITNVAYAREEETKKGMDGSQITGTASSYARKYALNGLFCIDDTKDADTDEHAKQTGAIPKKASEKQISLIQSISKDIKSITSYYKIEKLSDLTSSQASEVIKKLKGE